MHTNDEVLSALRKAVELSPESSALRRHYAELLLNRGHTKDAESQFRRAVDLDPADAESRLGLARALHSQNQHSTALFLVKQVIRESRRPAKAYILYARLLLALGSIRRAVSEYRKAIDADPRIHDPDLESRLGLEREDLNEPPEDDGDAVRDTAELAALLEDAVSRTELGDETNASLPKGAADSAGDPTEEGPDGAEPDAEDADTIRERAQAGFQDSLRQLFSERSQLTFEHVGGMETIKEEIRTILLHPLNHREHYRAYEKAVGGRLLMYGPPGCGKTHFARAIAGEVLAPFLAVGLSDLVDVWKGDSERVVHEIFDQARQQNPWVLLFDDVEQIGRGQPAVRQLLAELEGGRDSNDGLLVLVATRAPWDADPDLLSADRFDRVVFLPPPRERDRAEILRILCRGKPQDGLDLLTLARRTAAFTAADLRTVVDRTVEGKLARSLEQGRPQPITTDDLLETIDATTPSADDWFAIAREFVATAPRREALWDDLRHYLAKEWDDRD